MKRVDIIFSLMKKKTFFTQNIKGIRAVYCNKEFQTGNTEVKKRKHRSCYNKYLLRLSNGTQLSVSGVVYFLFTV